MDYSIRPINSAPIRPVGPRRERSDQAPFEFDEDGKQPAGNPAPQEHQATPADRSVAPPADDEVGSHLDLSA